MGKQKDVVNHGKNILRIFSSFLIIFIFALCGLFVLGKQAQAGITDTISGATNAYSLRTLKSSYVGPLVRIIITSGGEADVYGDASGEFSATSPITVISGGSSATVLSDFIVGTDAFIEIWYDQIGSVNVIQTTANNQPKIVNSGSIITSGLNYKPSIQFNGTSNRLQSTSSVTPFSQPATVFSVSTGSSTQLAANPRLFQIGTTPNRLMYEFNSIYSGMYSGSFATATASNTAYQTQVMTMQFSSTTSQLWINGSTVGTGNSGSNTVNGLITIGDAGTPGNYFKGTISEFIVYVGALTTTNRQAVEDDQKNYFVNIEAGTMLGVTGAKYAYGLRKLNSIYPGNLVRIRRTDGEKADVMPDSNGRFSLTSPITVVSGSSTDTTLSGFISGTNAFVEIWYDQVGNNNLGQSVQANQPKIVNNGSIIIDGPSLRPAIEFNTETSTANLFTVDPSYFYRSVSALLVSSAGTQAGGTSRPFAVGVSPNNMLLQVGSSGGMYAGSWLAGALVTTPYDLNQLSAIFNSASSALYKDGISVASGNAGPQSISGALYLGSGNAGAQPFFGKISEIIFYDSAISELSRQTIEQNQMNYFETVTPSLVITTPERGVSAEPDVATISYLDQSDTTVYIPYIQTSTDLSVAASAGTGLIPSGGGVKFILNEGESNERVLYDMTSPYSLTFTDLEKDTYTLDVYAVDSSQANISGELNHDRATDIGIGDIYVAIGDSITKGSNGVSISDCSPSNSITNWTESLSGTVSTDKRNYCQYASQVTTGYFKSWMPELNNELTAYNGYPVFILTEGYAGYTAAGFLASPMGTSAWQNRIIGLNPNKWLVMLGTNDTSSSSTYITNMTNILNTLIGTYGANASDITIGIPPYVPSRAVVQTYVEPLENLVSSMGMKSANFSDYFENNFDEISGDGVHPTIGGYVSIGRIYALANISPKNTSVTQNENNVTVNWGSLDSFDSIPNGTSNITGYYLKYGTSSGNYTTTIDVGNVTSKIVPGLIDGQQYFFTVQAYGGGEELSDFSAEFSFTYNRYVPPSNNSTGTTKAFRDRFLAEQESRRLAFQQQNIGTIIPVNQSPSNTFVRVLKYKMTGDDVKDLQIYLNANGYPVSITGAGSLNNETNYFGTKTRQAIMKFQKANNLVTDGIVGPKTLEKMK